MTAKDFYQPKRDLLHFSKLTSTGISTDYEAVFKFAEDYYNYKTKIIGDRVFVDGVLKYNKMDNSNSAIQEEKEALHIGVVSSSFSYDEFVLKLRDLGFNLRVVLTENGSSNYNLQVNGINVCGSDYPVFGRYCGGSYNPCGFSKQTSFTNKDIDKAINKCSEILMQEIERLAKIPNYFSCRDYLTNNFGKTKVEKSAIDRVFKLIKENYNSIMRSS